MQPPVITAGSKELSALLVPVRPEQFRPVIRRLQRLFTIYATTCPVPLPAPGLIVTPEIRAQCELYLPIAEVTAAFHLLYCNTLTYPPILSSTPFHRALSWADVFALLPPEFQRSPDPSLLLETLLADHEQLERFLCASFLPERFYGKTGRYPGQIEYLSEWLSSRKLRTLRCLDAACGTGEATYALMHHLSELGYLPEQLRIAGWTLEPLEVWAASFRRFPHNLHRERAVREAADALLAQGYGDSVCFTVQDILALPTQDPPLERPQFDLVICNGLLGGPIVNTPAELNLAVANLTRQLAPGGLLLTADNFHGGWKQQCPQSALQALLVKYGLKTFKAGEGVGGLKPDQETAPGQTAAKSHGQDQIARFDRAVAEVFIHHQRH